MRWLIILLLLSSGFVFFLQNQQSMTLFFLGNSVKTALLSLTFPVGLWVILFVVAGIITSLILQALNAISRPFVVSAPSPPPRPRSRQTPPPRSPAPEPPRSPMPETKTRIQTPTNPQWEWENPIPEVDDWEEDELPRVETPPFQPFEQPIDLPRDLPRRPEAVEPPQRVIVESPREKPSAPRPPVYPVEDSRPEPRLREEDLKCFEVSQEPKTSSQEGTIYSHTYREPSDRVEKQPQKPPASKPVYDANYRVINPPLRSVEPANLDDEDEDWL